MAAPDMQELMQKAKEMQQQMQKMQLEIMAVEVIGEAGGGLVKVRMNGAHQVIRVEVSPKLMGDDEDMLEDLVAAAFNDASKKIEETIKQRMSGMAKDLQLPEDFGGKGE